MRKSRVNTKQNTKNENNKRKLKQTDEINHRMQNNMTLLNNEMEILIILSTDGRKEKIAKLLIGNSHI